jgi:fructoselysine 6-phosphate deglycase
MNTNQVQQLNQALQAVKARTIHNIYFVACGGSKAIFEPAQYICDSEIALPSAVYTANEFVYRSPKGLGPNSLVISCSHSGNTPETVAATSKARDAGALTVCFSFKPGSPLWEAAEYGIEYTWGPESRPSESNNAMLLRLVFGILNVLSPFEKYQRALKCVDALDDIIAKNRAATLQNAVAYGNAYKREPFIYTMSSGACYGVAYSFAVCLLMEMLWIHSHAIHSGEYFHGPFEVTDDNVPFIIILNSGATRYLDERALAFAKKYSNRIEVIDTKTFDMDGICEDLQGYFAPAVVGAVLRQYADQLAEKKGHPLSVRRYMWKMEY